VWRQQESVGENCGTGEGGEHGILSFLIGELVFWKVSLANILLLKKREES